MSIALGIELFFMLLFIGFSYFFSNSEASIVAANPNVMKRLASGGETRASIASKLISDRKLFFGTILIGNNIAIVAFTTLGEHLTSGIGHEIHWMLLRILIIDGIILIAGEIMPKSIALENPDKNALRNAPTIFRMGNAILPLINAANYVPTLMIKGLTEDYEIGNLVTDRQFKLAFQQGHQAGIVDQESKDLGFKVIDFAETTVDRVMTLRGDIVSLPAEISVREAYERIRTHGYSRIPVYANDDEDNIVGFISVKDLIRAYLTGDHEVPISQIRREIHFVPFRKKVLDMMLHFKRERSHIAIVVDEAGNITGLVTLEDLLEEVVGEIYDEHDAPEESIQKLSNDTYLVDGKLEVEVINNILELELDETNYETIGGFVMGLFGRVPETGRSKQTEHAKFTVSKMDERRIAEVKIKIDRNGTHKHRKTDHTRSSEDDNFK